MCFLPPHPNPLPRKAGGEGTGIRTSLVRLCPDQYADTRAGAATGIGARKDTGRCNKPERT
jgi:hypothetical protein